MTSPQHPLAVLWDKMVRPSESLVIPEQRQLARLLSILLLAMIAATILANVSIFLSDPTYLTTTLPTTGPGLFALIVAYALSRTRHYRPAALIVLVALSAGSLVGAVINPLYRVIGPATLTQGLLLAAFYFSVRETGLIALGNGIALILILVVLPGSPPTSETTATIFLVTLESATILAWMSFRNQTERERRAEILESAERFQHMADSVPVLIWMSGADMLCTYFNRSWLEFTGLPLEHELGNGWSEGVHPDDLVRCLNTYITAFKDRKPFSMEYRLRRADGEYRWVRDDGAPRTSPDGVFLGYIGGCVDVTEHKEHIDVLRYQALLLDNMWDAVISADTTGTVMSWNRGAESIYGWRTDEALGQDLSALLQTEYLNDQTRDAVGAALVDEGRWQGELRQVRKDGSPMHIQVSTGLLRDSTNNPIGSVSINRDVTTEQELQTTLRRSEANLRAILDNAAAAYVLMDADTRVLLANRAAQVGAQAVFGRTIRPGNSVNEFLAESNRDDFIRNFETALRGGIATSERAFETPLGPQRTLEFRYFPATAPDSKVMGICMSILEITDRKQAERDLRHQAALLRTMADAVIETDLLSKVRSVNPAVERMFGWRADELIGKSAFALVAEETAPMLEERKRAVDTQGYWEGETTLKHKDGKLIPALLNVAVIKNAVGEPQGYVRVIKDITERKQAEVALRESETRFSTIFHASPVATLIARMSDTRFVDANDSFLALTGRSLDETIGKTSLDTDLFLTPQIRESVWQEIREKGEIRGREFQIRTKAGDLRDVMLSTITVELNGAKHLISMLNDITERKNAEAALSDAKDFLQQVVDTSPSMIFVVDGHGQVEFVNEYTANYYGTTPEELIAKSTQDVHRADTEAQEFVGDDQEVIRVRTRIAKEELNTAPGGDQHWFYTVKVPLLKADGTVRVLGISTDITDRKQAEVALRESEAKYRFLIDNSLQGLVILHEGHFVFANSAMSDITGYTVDELLAMAPEQVLGLVHPDDQARIFSNVQSRLAGNLVKTHNEHRIIRSDGQIRTVELLVSLTSYQGKPAVQANYIDINDRVMAEQELKRYRDHLEELVDQRTVELEAANEQLVRLGKAKDEFVSNVSHELRTPITSMKLRQRLAVDHPDALEKHMDVMRRETDRLHRIIEDLLQLSRLDQNRIELTLSPINLNDLISRYVSDRAAVTETKKLKVGFKSKARQPIALADGGLMEEVLGVLLTNATNYTPAGGAIVFATLRQKKYGRRWVGFCVSDTGPGIPKEDQPHLFERFFRGRVGMLSGAAGTGLGLALAKEIIERHHGQIAADSTGKPGEGTRFTVWLPEPPNGNQVSPSLGQDAVSA